MSVFELGRKLKSMYESAPQGYKVTFIHLFGIKYGYDILANKHSISDIVKSSGIKESFKTEVAKGIKLSKYVEVLE